MSKTAQQAETIRKMLFAMVKDIRVIMIKLADKLHNMRTLEYLEEASRKRIATECLEIYAPLAGRLGMSRMKDELEDLSFRILNPRAWEQIERFVAEASRTAASSWGSWRSPCAGRPKRRACRSRWRAASSTSTRSTAR